MYFFNVIVSILGTLHRAIVDKQVCKHKKASTHPCSLNTLTLFMEIHPHPPTHILYKRAQYSLSLSSHTHMRMHIRKKKKKNRKEEDGCNKKQNLISIIHIMEIEKNQKMLFCLKCFFKFLFQQT